MSRKASEAATKRLGTTASSAQTKAIDPVLTSLLAAIDQLAQKVDRLAQQK